MIIVATTSLPAVDCPNAGTPHACAKIGCYDLNISDGLNGYNGFASEVNSCHRFSGVTVVSSIIMIP